VKNWRKLAMEKESWSKLLRKARAQAGTVEPMMMMMMIRLGNIVLMVKQYIYGWVGAGVAQSL
jgi:hypothetical protein